MQTFTYIRMRKKTTIETEGHALLRARCDNSSQARVAAELSTTQATVSRICAGLVRPEGKLVALCSALFGWEPKVWLTEAELHSASFRHASGSRKRRRRSVQTTSKRAA